MWFIGLLLGAILGGSVLGFSGALSGALLGALAGVVLKSVLAQQSPPARSLESRLQFLEQRIDQLNRIVGEQQARLTQLEAPSKEALPSPAVAVPAAAQSSAPPEPAATEATSPAPVTPETETIAAPAPDSERPVPPPTPLPPTKPPRPERGAPNPLWARLFGGNILAKIGVVLLFFGVASGLKLAAQYGLFPIEVRLLLGAVAAIAMIVFGWNRVAKPEHRMFGLALQGGGFAILYLIVFFMLTRYQMLAAQPAFMIFVALGVGCVLLAALEDGVSLAVLGISGAFMAPVLASMGTGNHMLLFSYYALLNTFIIGVNWAKGWRALNLCGFLFTFLIGMVWGTHGYRQEYFVSVEGFLILFSLMYSLAPVVFALFKAPGAKSWAESTVIFGVPLAAAFSQAFLMRPFEYGLAWSAFIAGIYYLALWGVFLRRRDPALQVMERSHLAIAVALLTLAVPLAFGVALTSALWALEGAALVWLGTIGNRRPALVFGLLLQATSGMHFLGAFLHGDPFRAMPILNSACIGALILAIAGMLSAWFLRRADPSFIRSPGALSNAALTWGLLWWFGAGHEEIDTFVRGYYENAWLLGFAAASVLGFEYARGKLRWRELGATALVLTGALVVLAFAQMEGYRHALAGAMLLVLPLALASHHWILLRHENEGLDFFATARHLVILWLVTAVVGRELDWLAGRLMPGENLWPLLAWGVAGACATLATLWARDAGRWPVAARPNAYAHIGLAPIAVLLGLWSVYGNLTESGAYALPYVPLLNPFDLAQMLALFALLRWTSALATGDPVKTDAIRLPIYVLGFLWVSTMAARLGHEWADVPFRFTALYDSLFVQSALSLLWTTAAITLMITATRQHDRRRWFTGFALLGLVGVKLLAIDLAHVGTVAWTASLIGVALLVLAASYFSPAPPKDESAPGGAAP